MSTTATSAGIYLTEEERARLVEIARELGCVATRGRAPGEPSLRVLLREIAAGALVVRRSAGRPKARRKSASARVAEEIERDPDAGPAEIARRADCSVSLASRIMSGKRPAHGRMTTE